MKKTILYIAMSLDGYIADEKGGVDWLKGDGSDPNHKGTYEDFYETIDTVIIGYTTYHQVITELSPNQWVYEGKKTYVLTHKQIKSTDDLIFTGEPLEELVHKLKKEEGKDIYICGGASLIHQMLEHDLIDQICITILPILLGKGIPLFAKREKQLLLKFVKSVSYNGMTDLIYEKRE